MSDAEKIDTFIKKHEKWSEQLATVREILAATELGESIKWGSPCYSMDATALISLMAFKNHCAIWFHQGVFLEDKGKVLINAQEGTTKGLRQLRIESGDKIKPALIKTYATETIKNHRAGKKIAPAKKTLKVPAELEAAMKRDTKLKAAFATLTPGKQREYADHIGSAKQEKTRAARMEKARPLILRGVGLNDKYKNC
jgi:uncharacterized protein YdeI (YjbR/CyaY-like superfamily)